MSRETLSWLNQNTLIGFAEQRRAWHYRRELQGADGNHFTGPVPREQVEALFGFQLEARPVRYQVAANLDTATDLDEHGQPVRWLEAPGHIGVVRSDRPGDLLAIHSSGYTVHQYTEWLVDHVDHLLSGDVAIGSAGLLRRGAIAWVSAEIPDTFTTREGVAFRPRLLNTTSCDGSLATTRKLITTNVVCDNTLDTALGETGPQIKIKHSRRSDVRRTESLEILGLIHTAADAFTAQVAQLCAEVVTDRQWSQFVDALAPIDSDASKRTQGNAERKQAELNRLWSSDGRVAPWKGNVWGAYMAVNTYRQWIGKASGDRAERAMERTLLGRTRAEDTKDMTTLGRILDRQLVAA